MEIRLQRDRRSIAGAELLSVEWLLLQNPRSCFGSLRQRLPGQNHPGLGMLKDTVALLAASCERLHLDGVIFVPSTYHVAVQWHGHLRFLDRDAQARFHALKELLQDLPLAEATKAVAEGRVVDETTGEVFPWQPAPMIAPISERLLGKLEQPDDARDPSGYRIRLSDA